jgi:MFS family permease
MYFLGSIFGSVIVPRSADIFGRKPFTIGCTIIHVIACTVMLFTNSLTIAYIALSAQGFTMLGRALIGIVWLSESMELKFTTKSTGYLFFLDAFGMLFASLYFKYISKDWRYFYAVPAGMIFLAAIILCILFQDSPKFYYGRQ